MRGRLERRFDELVDNVFGRGAVGIAHAEIDDVDAAPARRSFHLPGYVEDVRGQTLDTTELFHGDSRIQASVMSGQW